MSDWGRAMFGDPCRSCGYEWDISRVEAVQLVTAFPAWARDRLDPVSASRRHPDLAWSVNAYVCHVADNLRIWSERLAGAAAGGSRTVAPYDQDLLATARKYEAVAPEGAVWSLERAVRDWADAVELALSHDVELVHPDRGSQTVEDICRSNAHDVAHHMWDIDRSLG